MSDALMTKTIDASAPDFHAALEAASLPTEDLADTGRTFFRFEDQGGVVGYGGYELYGEHALLRSVVVLPEKRGQGYGHKVSESVLKRAFDEGARRAYLLTTTAEDFFAHEGFMALDRKDAPSEILGTRQATTICSSAALLARKLDFHD